MSLDVALVLFQVVVLFFTICVQECAHAYTAWRLGDATGKMLGRITLNPLKQLDLIGSVIFPVIGLFYGWAPIGWGRPVPVTTRNFRHYRRDDILTALAGPASNLGLAIAALLLLVVLKHSMAGGSLAVVAAIFVAFKSPGIDLSVLPALFPIALLLYYVVFINLTMFVFNLIPIPPLDGATVLRHYLPPGALKIYDNLGIFSLVIFFLLGGRIMSIFFPPLLNIFNGVLNTL
ncbi:site-2 protease family protein [Granulicella sibirica]|uniref:Membrane metalloprotease n=1 Tax=Granulicella sibirica TaxID=2479048 RepID=A0A4Q0T800_9BACT|nr:site-2 protease family protein [Granulicella sibirica]RXH58850.1 membrane metalloprotease [Granulicella sibirica]